MKIVLAGSPKISVAAFEKVIKNFKVVGIVTQPDRKQNRGMKLVSTDVSKLGEKYGIKVFKPEKIGSIFEELKSLDYDIFLTFAFGQYVPTKVLDLAKKLSINIHGSLLPKYRGAAPIQYAILNNDKEIGITLIKMTKEMDAGEMLFKAKENITDKTTGSEAFEIIEKLAKENIVNWLKLIEENKYSLIKQPDNFSLSPKIQKDEIEIKLTDNVFIASRKIITFSEKPGAFLFINNKRIKIFNYSLNKVKNSIELKLSDGIIYATDYQWESKKRVSLLSLGDVSNE